jgi:hypothetical protein
MGAQARLHSSYEGGVMPWKRLIRLLITAISYLGAR